MNYNDEKTIDKAREFIRKDSTYYAGYMVAGAFHFYRANDELGYTQCVGPLENAMRLLERDFDKELRTRTNDYFTFVRVNGVQGDYCSIAYWLEQSYQNIERPDKAMQVLRRVRSRDLQLENGIESYNTMAWIYHRNRMYTPASGTPYKFLKRSVKANDSMAYMYLDSAIYNIQRNGELNAGIYDATYVNQQYLYVYHYKAILFDYNLEIDSAEYYYDVLLRTGYYSSNNYAEFRMAMGDLQTADEYFQEAASREGYGEKRTREYYYMRGTLWEYRAKPVEADSLLRRVIDKQGSTPGFGWHSIGLARALYYEGLTSESQDRINKAAKFHELHISTTWGQEQYNLVVEAVNYTNALRFEQQHYFENDQWYRDLLPMNWYWSSYYAVKRKNQKLLLASMIANNPERQQVVYPIFSSENLMNFDEVWSVIDGFGTDYFIKIYKDLLKSDKRPLIKKYYKYFLGKLYLNKGDKREAKRYFEEVFSDPESNNEFNALLYARTCEGLAACTSSEAEKDYYMREMYRTFPQLVPFSEQRMKFRLNVNGQGVNGERRNSGFWPILFIVLGIVSAFVMYYMIRSGRIKAKTWMAFLPLTLLVIISVFILWWNYYQVRADKVRGITEQLKECHLDITDDPEAPLADITIIESENGFTIDYSVMLDGKYVIEPRTSSLTVSGNGIGSCGKLLAYDLFGIRKDNLYYKPKAVNAVDPKKVK